MTPRGLAVLSALLVLTVGAILWLGRAPDRGAGTAEPATLLPASTDPLRRIEIERGPTRITLERGPDERWLARQPFAGEADPLVVDALVRSLQDCRVVKVVDEETRDAPRFGLDPAAIRVRLLRRGQTAALDLRLGRRSPIGFEQYATVDGRRVVLIDASLGESLERDPEEMRERRLVPFDPERITRIDIRRAGRDVVLERRGTAWVLLRPVGDRADASAAEAFARRIAGLRVERVADGGESVSAGAPLLPATEVRVDVKEAGVWRFEIAAAEREGRRWARRTDGTIAGPVIATEIEELERDPESLRDLRVGGCAIAEIREVRFIRGSERLILERSGGDGGWTAAGRDGSARPADLSKVESILDRLCWLRAESIAEPGEVSGAPPVTVEFVGAAGPMGSMEIAAPSAKPEAKPSAGTPSLVRSSWRPGCTFRVSSGLLDGLPRTPADFAPSTAAPSAPASP